MSSAQERPGGTAGTTGPTDSSAGAGDMAGRGAATGAGTPGYERAGAHRAAEAREAEEYEGAGLIVARAGFTFLAAVLMIFSGLVTFFYGIVGIIQGSFFTTLPTYIFTIGPSGRGITELVLGALIFAAGVCLILGMMWARMVGVVLAVLTGIANFMFLPWYPVWSFIVIALNVFIIWALLTGGRRQAA